MGKSTKAHLEACARYRNKNKEKVRSLRIAYYKNNKEKIKAKNYAWAKANPEARRKSKEKYIAKHAALNKVCWIAAQAIRSSKHYASNRSIMIKRASEWNVSHPGKRSITRRKYYESNTAKIALLQKRRCTRRDRATPKWNNPFFMNEAYALARLRTKMLGFKWDVDHIVPIMSDKVCGLHAHTNIRVIPHTENGRKSNLCWPHMPGIEHGD